MATPNFKALSKTITGGVVIVDIVNDGLEVGGEVDNAEITVSGTGPINALRMLAGGDPLEFSDSSKAWMFTMRTADGTGFAVTHMAGGGTPASEQIYIPMMQADSVISANHVFGIWKNGGPARLNLYLPLGPATTPVEGSTNDPSRNTNSFADLAEMSVTFTPFSTYCDVEFECTMKLDPAGSGATASGQVQLVVNGLAITASIRSFSHKSPAAVALTSGFSIQPVIISRRVTGLTPGASTTIKVQWKATNGTIVAVGTERTLRIW